MFHYFLGLTDEKIESAAHPCGNFDCIAACLRAGFFE